MPGTTVADAQDRAPGLVEQHAAGTLSGHLAALQLADSAFPSGRYTLSHGVEGLAQQGYLHGPRLPQQLLEHLATNIRFGAGPSDGTALAWAYRSVNDAHVDLVTTIEVDQRLTGTKLAREPREGSHRTGRALLRTAAAVFPYQAVLEYDAAVRDGATPGNHAVAMGVISACTQIPMAQAVAAELFTLASGWLSAAVRLNLINHHQAQALLNHVRPPIAEATGEACSRQAGQIVSCTPLLDVVSMRHEEAQLRLFAN